MAASRRTSQPAPRATALVTGATSGLGLLAAIALESAGFAVLAAYRTETRRRIADAIARREGSRLSWFPLDVASPRSIASLTRMIRSVDALEVVVNSAGFALDGFFEDLSDRELRAQFETNFFGTTAVTRAVLPAMRRRGKGWIFNLSTPTARAPMPGATAYCASKAAVEAFSQALRHEVRPFGVQVCVLVPSNLKSELLSRNRVLAKRSSSRSSPYRAATLRMEREIEQLRQHAGDPAPFVRVLLEAIGTSRAKPRYLIGASASRRRRHMRRR